MHKNNKKYWIYYLILEKISTADFWKYVVINTVLVTAIKILIPNCMNICIYLSALLD